MRSQKRSTQVLRFSNSNLDWQALESEKVSTSLSELGSSEMIGELVQIAVDAWSILRNRGAPTPQEITEFKLPSAFSQASSLFTCRSDEKALERLTDTYLKRNLAGINYTMCCSRRGIQIQTNN